MLLPMCTEDGTPMLMLQVTYDAKRGGFKLAAVGACRPVYVALPDLLRERTVSLMLEMLNMAADVLTGTLTPDDVYLVSEQARACIRGKVLRECPPVRALWLDMLAAAAGPEGIPFSMWPERQMTVFRLTAMAAPPQGYQVLS